MNQAASPEQFFSFNYYPRIGKLGYKAVLAQLHEMLDPKSYFEIGSKEGSSLCLAKCTTIAVDPRFMLAQDIIQKKPVMMMFQMTSDRFFEKYDPRTYFAGNIDLAFLDGMHHSEFLLRDFINTEKYCNKDSVILLHDCLPGERIAALRDPKNPYRKSAINPRVWAGDVWKVVPMLQQYRPDLRIVVSDAAPTGLVLISGLSPENTVLSSNYDAIVGEMNALEADGCLEAFWAECDIVPAEQTVDKASLSKFLFD